MNTNYLENEENQNYDDFDDGEEGGTGRNGKLNQGHVSLNQKQRMVAALQAGADRVREAALQEWRNQQRVSAMTAKLLRPALTAALAVKQRQAERDRERNIPCKVLLSVLRKECAERWNGDIPPFSVALSVLLSIVHGANIESISGTTISINSTEEEKAPTAAVGESAENGQLFSLKGPLWLRTVPGIGGDVEIIWQQQQEQY